MARLLPILLSLAAGDIGEVVARKRRNAWLYALAGLLAFTAWMAAVAGAILAAARYLGPVEAAFLAAALLAAGALLVVAAVLLLNRRDRMRREKAAPRSTLAAAAALALLPAVTRSPPLLLAAGLAGLAYVFSSNAGGEHPEDD